MATRTTGTVMRNMNDLEPWSEETAQELGRGTFGRVYLGFLKARGSRPRTEVAIKVLKNIPEGVKEQKKVIDEVKMSKKLCFPSVMSDIFLSMQSERWCIISLRARCSLSDMLASERKSVPMEWQNSDGLDVVWSPTKRVICAIGIAAGLAHIHNLGVIHRDIKPANILLNDKMWPLISDFGLSRDVPTEADDITRGIGTPLYMAPEILKGEVYERPADVYAYGLLLYELVTGNPIFQHIKSSTELVRELEKGTRPQFDSSVATEWKELIESCWDTLPANRPTMQEVAERLRDIDFSSFDFVVDQEEVDNYRNEIYEALDRDKR